tara:strand:+ start:639 stop:1592 length:954 start_codon:yes stop_codon:yes gene_type:complete
MTWNVKVGDCVELMKSMKANSVDAIVTDPPYGIGYGGKEWDSSVPGDAWANQCFRVLKPGGHLVAFGHARLIHRLACIVEEASFEIRDQINWIYYTGYPASMAVDVKGFEGYQTALKPAHEPAILARKPLEGTVALNVQKHGTGALNVEACRISVADNAWPGHSESEQGSEGVNGKWPANVYYCAKPSARERDRGCHHMKPRSEEEMTGRRKGSAGIDNPRAGAGRMSGAKNHHPTVKPVKLMSWLCRLVGGKRGSLILDPFCGSGTTGVAAVCSGFDFIGFDISADYAEISANRIVGASPLFNEATRDLEFLGVKR